MNCIIVDDEPKAISVLKKYCADIHILELRAWFGKALAAAKYCNENEIDLVFLDIQMPGTSGFEFIKLLKHHPLIIFTTSFPEYAAESYNINAVDYLLKPITYDRFSKAVLKAKEIHSFYNKQERKDLTYFFVRSGTDFHKLHTDDILFFEKLGNYIKVVTRKESLLTRMSFGELQTLIDDRFVRTHKSYIVSLPNVTKIANNKIVINNHTLPIGIIYKKDFLKRVNTTDK